MENEMIERVARALCASNCLGETPVDGPFADANWPRHADDARAAIEAMREPGEGVMVAGAKHLTGSNVAGRTYRVWKAMIDAALEPAKQPA